MAQVGHRVDYLAGFCCPVGGLAAGKPRVLCHENQIYLSNGTEYVYVYDQEGRLMKVRLVLLVEPSSFQGREPWGDTRRWKSGQMLGGNFRADGATGGGRAFKDRDNSSSSV